MGVGGAGEDPRQPSRRLAWPPIHSPWETLAQHRDMRQHEGEEKKRKNSLKTEVRGPAGNTERRKIHGGAWDGRWLGSGFTVTGPRGQRSAPEGAWARLRSAR